MKCMECGSPMEPRDGMWACDTCFNVVAVVSHDDDTILEEGLTLQDVLRQMEERQ